MQLLSIFHGICNEVVNNCEFVLFLGHLQMVREISIESAFSDRRQASMSTLPICQRPT
jgi:hypothetical protein